MSRQIFRSKILAIGMLSCAVSTSALAETDEGQSVFGDDQVNAIEQVIYDYLMTNPEVIIEAVEVLQAREEAEAAAKIAQTLEDSRDEIYNSPDSHVAGNPNGDLTIVEFFDYNCGYCKRGLDDLLEAVEEDSNVRLVFKEYPILSEDSVLAARAALASRQQGKYMDFHVALMRSTGGLSADRIDQIAKSIGINVKQLHKDMEDPKIVEMIAANKVLADNLSISGTPNFIIADQIFPGLLEKDQLTQVFAELRAAKKDAAVN